MLKERSDEILNNENNLHPNQNCPLRVNKINRYKWELLDKEPGELAWLKADEIKVDREYQRNLNRTKMLEIARAFSWVSFGVIVVAERDGVYYAIDGQHRLEAAKNRGDMEFVPCIIFRTKGKKQEAENFVRIQKNRKSVTAIEKFRALLVIEDPDALFVKGVLSKYNIKVITGSNEGKCATKAIFWFLKSAKEDQSRTDKVARIASNICMYDFIPEKLLDGTFYIDKYMPGGICAKFEKRMYHIGLERLMESVRRACSFFGRGGAKVIAEGMMQEINKGLRSKFELQSWEDKQILEKKKSGVQRISSPEASRVPDECDVPW